MSILDKAKDAAEALVDKVKDQLDQRSNSKDSTSNEAVADSPPDRPESDTGEEVVTPADVAEAVADPNLPHPTPPGEQPAP